MLYQFLCQNLGYTIRNNHDCIKRGYCISIRSVQVNTYRWLGGSLYENWQI